jgi:hypothetical protein
MGNEPEPKAAKRLEVKLVDVKEAVEANPVLEMVQNQNQNQQHQRPSHQNQTQSQPQRQPLPPLPPPPPPPLPQQQQQDTAYLLRPTVCPFCFKDFSTKTKMERHIATACQKIDGMPRPKFMCSVCEYKFTRQDKCEQHQDKSKTKCKFGVCVKINETNL